MSFTCGFLASPIYSDRVGGIVHPLVSRGAALARHEFGGRRGSALLIALGDKQQAPSDQN
jgi:hypothetical protein